MGKTRGKFRPFFCYFSRAFFEPFFRQILPKKLKFKIVLFDDRTAKFAPRFTRFFCVQLLGFFARANLRRTRPRAQLSADLYFFLYSLKALALS